MYNLKAFRNYVGITQVELADIFKCTQPNIAKLEKLYSDLTTEQFNLLSTLYGEESVSKFIITEESETFKPVQTNIGISDSKMVDLISEQQKSINDLINMVKHLQIENSKLTDAIINKKII